MSRFRSTPQKMAALVGEPLRGVLRRLPAAAIFLVLAAGAARAQDSQIHEVKLVRPAAVGDAWHIVAEGRREKTETMRYGEGEQPPDWRTTTIKLQADAEVLAIDVDHRPTRIRYVITICTIDTGAGATAIAIAPAGSVLIAGRRINGTTYELDGGALTDQVRDSLDLILSFPDPDVPDDDDALGTAARVVPGASWPINREPAARMLAAAEVNVDAEELTGVTTFLSVKNHLGVRCMELQTRVQSDAVTPAQEDLPEGLTVETATLRFESRRLLPLDVTKPQLSQTTTQEEHIKVSGEVGPQKTPVVMESRTKRYRKVEITPR